MRKALWIAAGLAAALSAPAYADTPIGAGVTGSGGTGPNRSDPPNGVGVTGNPDSRIPAPGAAPRVSGSAAATGQVNTDRGGSSESVRGTGASDSAGATGDLRRDGATGHDRSK
jgi:hypothetical protein